MRSCQVCSSNKLFDVLDLGMQPPSDAFLTKEQVENEILYPLNVIFCEDCKLVQLEKIIDSKKLFTDNFVYSSSTNKQFIDNLEFFCKIENEIDKNELILDIGSNDGSFLKFLMNRGYKNVIGIDPSNISSNINDEQIRTIIDFFNERTAEQIKEKFGKCKVITGFNVLAHTDNIVSFLSGISKILSDDGIFITESHYLFDLINKIQYDEIYHEHARYYSLTSLMNLFNIFNLEIFSAKRTNNQGGSILVFAGKKKTKKR